MSKNLLQLLINIDKIPNENPGYKCDYKFNRYIEAPQSTISALSGKLGMLNGVTAKVLYAR